MNKQCLIEHLKLQPHPKEGGYFARTYTSNQSIQTAQGERPSLSAIYYLLTDDQPIGYLHRNQSDILHCFHSGYPLCYLLLSPDGTLHEKWLGNDILAGQHPQLLVPGNTWKASTLEYGDFALISEAVTPGFDYKDNELASEKIIKKLAPSTLEKLKSVIKD